MAWPTNLLSDTALRTAKPGKGIRKLTDGKGLQFWVTPQGGKYWRYEYRHNGKRKLLALGTYPEMPVSLAREKAVQARQQLAAGQDPSEVRRAEKQAKRLSGDAVFANIAAKLVEKKRKSGIAPVTLDKMEWILRKVDTDLGHRPIATITTPDILKCLAREEEAGNLETARRMRSNIGGVFRFAMQQGLADRDPTQGLKGAVATPKPKHLSAILKPERFGELLRLINDYTTRNVITGSALKLMALLYPRPGELRQARWEEFDLDNGKWTIPAERMKLRQEHVKALSRQAVEILKHLHEITGPQGYVFPAVGRSAHPMSENTLNAALRRMGISADEHTSHGFRATASTLLNASNRFSPDAIERSLAHQDNDAVRRAYARGNAWEERQKMAQWWADFIDRTRAVKRQADNILHLPSASRGSQ